jgi:RHS repeat-associated protein
MILRLLLWFFCVVVYAKETDFWSVISVENEPSVLVDGKINAITGTWARGEIDLVIQGVEPIVIYRSYLDGEWSVGPSMTITQTSRHKHGHTYTMVESTGAKVEYKFTEQKVHFGKEQYRKYVPVDLKLGYTNTSRGKISSRTNPHNNVLFVGPKEKELIVHCADGTVRTYRLNRQSDDTYRLESERLPNGNWVLYRYQVLEVKERKITRLVAIRTTDPTQRQVYAGADFVYRDKKGRGKSFKIVGSDGQTVEYTYQKSELADIESSRYPHCHYEYDRFSAGLCKVLFPLNRGFGIDYYYPQTTNVNGREVQLDNRTYEHRDNGEVSMNTILDSRCGLVATLSAPVGTDAALHVTHAFFYDLHNRKTTVYDAENKRTEYQWDCLYRIQEMSHYGTDGRLQKVDKFSWNHRGNLLALALLDEHRTPLWTKNYSYNSKGDIEEERIVGNLSGLSSDGNESFGRKFKYCSQGEMSLLQSVEDDDGHRIEYTYLPDTDLPTSQCTYDQGEVKERKFWEYDAKRLLVCEKTETKMSTLIRRMTPKKAAPYLGMPEAIEEKYLDGGQECLIRKTVLHYTTGAKIAQKDIYDSRDQFQYSLLYKYDDKGRVVEQTDAGGRVEQFAYDAVGNRILHKHPSGRKTATFHFDFSNRLIASQQMGDDGITLNEEYAYDKNHRLIREKKPLGYSANYFYDSYGNLSKKELGFLDKPFTYVNDCFGRVIAETNPEGSTTKKAYNAYNKPTLVEYPDGGVERFVYYKKGLLQKTTNPEGTETLVTYDYQDRTTSKTVSHNHQRLLEEFWEYDGPNLISKWDAASNQTSYFYDRAGRIHAIDFANDRTEFAYDTLGRQILERKGPLSKWRKYDLLDRIVEETEGGEEQVLYRVQYEYDAADNQTAIRRNIDGKEAKEEFCYDSLGRRIRSIDPLGNVTQTLYEHGPCLNETVIDPLGLRTVKKYNAQQKVAFLEIWNKQGTCLSKQEFSYDWRGNPTDERWSVPRSEHTRLSYDVMGRLTQKIEAADQSYAKVTSHSYDKSGRRIQTVKPNGVSLHYSYDPLDHLTALGSSDRSIHYVYSYDLLGRQISSLDLNTNQKNEKVYDRKGRVIEEKMAHGFTVSSEYDCLDRRTQFTLPDSSLIRYDYDPRYLRKILRYSTSKQLLYVHAFDTYDQSGNSISESLISDLGALTHAYNLLGQEDALISPCFSHRVIQRDAVGNVLQSSLNDKSQTFAYDDLYQLSSEEGHVYTMDASYCRLQKDEEKYEVNDLHQIVSHFEYDQNGNPIKQGDVLFVYDALDRLIKVQVPAYFVEFTYDADHRRLSKSTFYPKEDRGRKVFYLYDGQKEIGSIDAQKNIQEFRVINPTAPSETGASVAIEIQNHIYAPIHDLMGNICLLISSQTRKVAAYYSYTVFEEDKAKSMGIWSPWRYLSKRVDSETGLIYFGRRYYSPQLGAWLTPDPAESSSNLYAFVKNNPWLYIDLYGLYTADRASDAHYFDERYPRASNFALSPIGDSERGTVHYHSGINNTDGSVAEAQTTLYNLFQEQYAIAGYWIHHNNLAYGLTLVAAEKIRGAESPVMPFGFQMLGSGFFAYSYMNDVIAYEAKLLKNNAEEILKEDSPRIKQVHLLFSNASYPFREALRSLSFEEQDTIIIVSCGPTTFIENSLAHRVYNIIGEKDWPARFCHGLFKGFMGRDDVNIEFIEQTETKPGVFGHYFEQPDYQNEILKNMHKIKNEYDIY